MKASSAAWLVSLLVLYGCVLEEVQAHGIDKRGINHRHNLYKGRIEEGEIV